MTPIAARQLTTIPFGNEQNTNQRIINETFIRNAFSMNGIKFASLPVSQMSIDEDYQRPPQRKINKIAKEWNVEKCRVIEVSYRNNQFYVVDGQNRYLAALQVGEECLPCQIHIGLTKEQEAEIFSSQDDNKTKVSTADKFNADIAAKKPDAMRIQAICDEFNIIVGRKRDVFSSNVRSLDRLKAMWKTGQDAELRWVFNVIKEAGWHTAKNGYCDDILSALHQVYICNRHSLEEVKPMVVNFMSQTSPDMLTARARIAYSSHGRKVATHAYVDRYLSQCREGVIIL